MKYARKRLLFLCWEVPWPAHSGFALRTMGIIRELAKRYEITILIMSEKELSSDQASELKKYTEKIIRFQLLERSILNGIRVLWSMIRQQAPYHCALLRLSVQQRQDIQNTIDNFQGIVFTSLGHWGTLIRPGHGRNWILNQCDADIKFWKVYAANSSNILRRIVALANYQFAVRHFPKIYAKVNQIVSVCEEDRAETQLFAPNTLVNVIENGIDCSYYAPARVQTAHPPRLLFTGTSAPRNMKALHQFVNGILPHIRSKIPNVELIVAGNFSQTSQQEFSNVDGIKFTGKVDDIRPFFNMSDIFIAPFTETHGSKLKISEAMAMGIPIVSTPEGVRGFSVTDGCEVRIAYSDQQFVNLVIDLLHRADLRTKMGEAGRLFATSTLDWIVLGRKIQKIVENLDFGDK